MIKKNLRNIAAHLGLENDVEDLKDIGGDVVVLPVNVCLDLLEGDVADLVHADFNITRLLLRSANGTNHQ